LNISVFGIGYVGLANAALLAQHNAVMMCDISSARVDMLNKGISPIKDAQLESFLHNEGGG
jgi:UDPglucose 6-dehydrogenase